MVTSEQGSFGTTRDGTAIEKYTLRNRHGMQATIITYGATLQSLIVRDNKGAGEDVVLGFDDVQGYETHGTLYFGAINGPYALHGGTRGFDKQVWQASLALEPGWVGVRLSHVSPDGYMGFPGTLETQVTYSLNDDNELRIQYQAMTDKPTVLNLTHHSYFNMAGAGNGDVLQQIVTLYASRYTPVTEALIPTGELAPVAGTPMDFLTPTAIGKNIRADHPQLIVAEPGHGGYDLNGVLDTRGNLSQLAAEVRDPQSGRHLLL